ncbi:biopolymer transporter ExbD [Fusobacterium perfoetens]|uniref:ExbD/TolR family protein n=1 Tax=Fusobacterium perfoetens TaxID=852 RepID=UPI001F166E3A|nr:biopolymer transporter ExbD [Fusobacterium perfoetens]MCF2625917.1 biopolymer transporter ExbD [Fusobacterium perfoetens]
MGRYRKKRNIMSLDLTPLIDVVFLLLIFFMVSTTFNKYGKIEIDVPTSNVTAESKESKIEIVIDKNQNYFIIKDEKTYPIKIEDLGNHLAGIKEVSITGDKNLKYQIIMDTITKVKEQGVENLGINFYE